MPTKPIKKLSLSGRSHIDVFYTKGHSGVVLDGNLDPLLGLVGALDKAKHEIVFAIFSFTAQPILDAFVRAKGRGVKMRGVADANSANGPTSKIKALQQVGVDCPLIGSSFALMHLKVAVIDGLRTAYGSYNWTTVAERSNDELLTVVTNRNLATVCISQIDAIRKAV